MAIPATHCEAKKHAYRQTQDGIVVSFVLHPNEVPDDLALAPLGTRYVLALVRIGDDETPQPPNEKPKRSGQPFHTLPRPQQAGMMCNNQAFQRWASSKGMRCGSSLGWDFPQTAGGARKYILAECAVTSRADLDGTLTVQKAWDVLLARFNEEMRWAAEAR